MIKEAIIIFTRIPEDGKTKTRLMPSFSPRECKEFHTACIKDIFTVCSSCKRDIIISYLPGNDMTDFKRLFDNTVYFRKQRGDDLGSRMYNALSDALKEYDRCILIGTDVPELKRSDILSAFLSLNKKDIVLGPTTDGGYYLVGMKQPIRALFSNKTYGHKDVFRDACRAVCATHSIGLVRAIHDIDTNRDIHEYMWRLRKIQPKAASPLNNTQHFLIKRQQISIIIPVYNEEKTIAALQMQLWSIRNQCEIIFVDGGSTDHTKEMIHSDFIFIASNKGRAAQMNTGALKSHGDILLFLHSDSILPSNALSEIRSVMTGHFFGAFGIRFPSKSILMHINQFLSNMRMRRGILFGDQGIFIDRDLFFKIGMYPALPIMEDYQLSLTLKELRLRPGFTSRPIITSDRRYPKNPIRKLLLMAHMANLRRRYRKGGSPYLLASEYKDIRK